MRSLVKVAAVTAALLLIWVLAGCSSSSGPGSGSDLVGSEAAFKIAEYVGDGHNGTKPPWTALFPVPGQQGVEVQTQGSPTKLTIGANYVYANVYPTAVNWYYLAAIGPHAAQVLVTMQPVHNRDADLYLLNGKPYMAPAVLAYSTRYPLVGQPDPVNGVNYAPDWCYYDFADTAGYVASQIACFGVKDGVSGARYFRLEADMPWGMTVNGAALSGHHTTTGQSVWYRFTGQAGHNYTVHLTAVSGDPDVYCYGNSSTTFKGKSVVSGGGDVAVAATSTGYHFSRVYAYNNCTWNISVTEP